MPGKTTAGKSRKTTASKRRKTKWQMLLGAKARYCKGTTTKATLNKAGSAYVADAVKKGKTKAEAQKSVSKLVSGACNVGKTKKRKPVARKSKTTRRRRAARK